MRRTVGVMILLGSRGRGTYKAAQDKMVQHHKLGRNDPCHCGSGKKYKKCHLALDQQMATRMPVTQPDAVEPPPPEPTTNL